MDDIERIGISIEKKLLSKFDKLIDKQGYRNRSEAVRDMIREKLSDEQVKNPKAEAVAAVFLVYDHHNTKLSQKLLGLQHSHLLKTISSMHVHISHHECLEVIVLNGKVGEITKLGENILSLKGVKFGKVNLIATI